MPRLPDVTDYGQRPTLRSNRVDPVHDGSAVAESVAIAAEKFASMYGQKKAKDDRLNYALAKNELTGLDIAQRESLKDREDWQKFDDDYTTGFNAGRDQILGKYELSPSDNALLQSESELIRERGRVYANDLARKHEIDQGRARVIGDLDTMLEHIQVAPPEQQNELMLQALDTIMAAADPESGNAWFTEEEAQNEIQAFVSKAALGALEAMSAEERIAELELSLSHRKARGPVDKDDIAAGKGSGSIADFLHSNIARRMLEESKNENEAETELAAAQALVDEIEANNPGDPEAMGAETRRLARERNLTPGARARAEQIARSRAEEIRVNRNASRTEQMIALGEEIAAGASFNDLAPSAYRNLTPGQVSNLKSYDSMLKNGQQFANTTNWHEPKFEDGQLVDPSYSYWTKLSDAQKAEVDLDEPMWHTNFEQGVWKQMADHQERIRNGTSQTEKDIQTLDQIVTDVWTGELGQPRTGREEDEDQMYYMMRSRIASEIDRLSDEKYGGQRVPDDERKDIARKIMAKEVYERDKGLRGLLWGRDSDEPMPIVEVDPDNYRDYYVPITIWRDLKTTLPVGPDAEPVELSWEAWLTRRGERVSGGRKPNRRDLENAYAQIVIGGDAADVLNRVDEALKGKYEY